MIPTFIFCLLILSHCHGVWLAALQPKDLDSPLRLHLSVSADIALLAGMNKAKARAHVVIEHCERAVN